MIQYNVGSYGIYSTFDNITESATIVDISVCTFMEKNIEYILYSMELLLPFLSWRVTFFTKFVRDGGQTDYI